MLSYKRCRTSRVEGVQKGRDVVRKSNGNVRDIRDKETGDPHPPFSLHILHSHLQLYKIILLLLSSFWHNIFQKIVMRVIIPILNKYC